VAEKRPPSAKTMETPLNAREFIKRFHLPQLVRISGLQEPDGRLQASRLDQLEREHFETDSSAADCPQQSLASCAASLQSEAQAEGHRLSAGASSLRVAGQEACAKQRGVSDAQRRTVQRREPAGAQIKLTPPSKGPTLSRLKLEQPFLLYKAYRKLELRAYLVDSKNELTEKSGDPIYFPHNYPGKLAAPFKTW